MAKAFSIWKERRKLRRPSNEPTLELHSSLTHALNFNGKRRSLNSSSSESANETLNYVFFLGFLPMKILKSTNLSSTVSHLALLFQVIYSWNNHQQNNEATNLLHFPFFAFCVCQGLSHLELKGKTLLRMGELWAQRCFLSSSARPFGKRWIAGLMAVKLKLLKRNGEG